MPPAVPAGMISDQAARYLWDTHRVAERITRFTTGSQLHLFLVRRGAAFLGPIGRDRLSIYDNVLCQIGG